MRLSWDSEWKSSFLWHEVLSWLFAPIGGEFRWVWVLNYKALTLLLAWQIHSRLCFIEKINSSKAHACWVHVIIINANLLEICLCAELVLRLSCFFNELVRNYLSHFHAVIRFVTVNFPLENSLFWMKLYSIERILSGLPYTHKFFVVRRSSLANNLPKFMQLSISIVSVAGYCIMVIEISDTLPVC